MPTFQYTARTPTGQRTTGALEAASEAAAVRMLDEQRLFPVNLQEQVETGAGRSHTGVRTRDLALMFEQLSDLLRAGVPMMRAIETLARTHGGKRMHRLLEEIAQKVADGDALSDAMAEQPGVFNPLHIAMIRAGERGGFLENVLNDLAGYLERQDELRTKVYGAMIYPMVLVAVGLAVIFAFLVGIVPQFKALFEGAELPLPSRLLFATSETLVEQWPATLGGLMLLGIGLAMFFTTEAGREAWAHWQLRIPILGHTIRMVSLTRFCRILGTMLASGVPILQALQISRDAAGTRELAAAIDEAVDSVRDGQGLTTPLRRSGAMPEQILEMMAVAEESNQLEKVLLKVADTVERRTNQQVDHAVRLLEPVILVFLAGAILFVALGVLYPIFTMSRTIG